MPDATHPFAGGKQWRFTQLGGDRKELIFGGLDAPFGRPRQKPVVRDQVEVRENTIYYAGSNLPTRHVFGVRYAPWELQGRIGDRNPVSSNPSQMQAGPGYTKAFVDYIKKFVSDQQPVQAQWGDILSAKAFLKSFDPAREAEYEVEYRLTVLIDSDETSPTTVQSVKGNALAAAKVANAVNNLRLFADKIPSTTSIKPSLLDSLDNLVTTFTSATGVLINAASAIGSIEKAISTDLQRLRAAIGQVKTAAIALQNTLDSIQVDVAIIRRSWSTDVDFTGSRAQSDAALMSALAQLEDVNKQAELAERGQANSSYVAKLGDTWELIAQNTLGAPDKADVIRAANGVRYGQSPEPGRPYKIPFP